MRQWREASIGEGSEDSGQQFFDGAAGFIFSHLPHHFVDLPVSQSGTVLGSVCVSSQGITLGSADFETIFIRLELASQRAIKALGEQVLVTWES